MFNMELKSIDPEKYVDRIIKIEVMLEEIKQELSLFNGDFVASINRGEKDIEEGRITICKTEEELENFFASI